MSGRATPEEAIFRDIRRHLDAELNRMMGVPTHILEGNSAREATARSLTVETFLDAAKRLSVYQPIHPFGYVFGPQAERFIRDLGICRKAGYNSLLGVPCWIDADMVGAEIEAYYNKSALEKRVKGILERDKARAEARAKGDAQ